MLVVCAVIWLLAGLTALGILPMAGALPLDLYSFYSFASVCGWIAGNVFVRRRQRLGPTGHRWLALAYLIAPPSLLFLLRALATLEQQRSAPLVPAYGLVVYLIFFLVPVTLRQPAGRPRSQ